MDHRQLRAFLAVFEERNITAAAQRIHLSQPALSTSLKLLEEDLGVQLFQRVARGVEATDAARELYPLARRMVTDGERLRRRFREEQDRVPLDVGIEGDLAPAMVRSFVMQVSATIPELLLTLHEGCTGQVRLGCEEQRCEDELFLPLWTDPYVLALHAEHPLAQQAQLHAHDLADVCWIMCPEHPSHQRFLPLYGATVSSPAAQATSFSLSATLVDAGIGVAVLPQSLVSSQQQLVTRPLPGLALNRRIGLCFGLHALDTPAVAQLYAKLGEAGDLLHPGLAAPDLPIAQVPAQPPTSARDA